MLYKYKNIYIRKSFTDILQKYKYNINTGDIVGGIIRYREKDRFLVEVGDNIASHLPIEEIQPSYNSNSSAFALFLYFTRDFFLITYQTETKKSILSIKRLEYIRAWKRIKQIYLEDIVFKLNIEYINKGGLITYVEGLKGFIPNSYTYNLSHTNVLVKSNILCKLSLINEHKNEIILCQKSASLHLSKHKFRLGELIYGKIVSIQNYGVFIEIYEILGLLHISEISEYYIGDIHKIFRINNLIKIKIIHINKKQGRLSVSSKHL